MKKSNIVPVFKAAVNENAAEDKPHNPPSTPEMVPKLTPGGTVEMEVNRAIDDHARSQVSPQLRGDAPIPHKQHLLPARAFNRAAGVSRGAPQEAAAGVADARAKEALQLIRQRAAARAKNQKQNTVEHDGNSASTTPDTVNTNTDGQRQPAAPPQTKDHTTCLPQQAALPGGAVQARIQVIQEKSRRRALARAMNQEQDKDLGR